MVGRHLVTRIHFAPLTDQFALAHHERAAGQDMGPCFVPGERGRGQDDHAIIGRCFLGEIDFEILVYQAGLTERRLAFDIAHLGRATGIERASIAEQGVENAKSAQIFEKLRKLLRQLAVRGPFGKCRAQCVHQPAKGVFAIGGADRHVVAERALFDAFQLAVMGEAPGVAPQFAAEGMGVFQRCLAAIGLTHMGNDHQALDRVGADEARQFGMGAGIGVVDRPAALVLVETDAPAVGMRTRGAATLGKRREAETDIGRYIGAHRQQFTHHRLVKQSVCF